jgi:hypothetical protein
MVRAFTQNHGVIEEKLLCVDNVMHADGAVAAYGSMMPGQGNYLKFMGPAYFTKHLYFTGYGTRVPGAKPLILDSRVARALSRRSGFEGIQTYGWSADTYERYLEFASAQVREPEDVEAELFLEGRLLR